MSIDEIFEAEKLRTANTYINQPRVELVMDRKRKEKSSARALRKQRDIEIEKQSLANIGVGSIEAVPKKQRKAAAGFVYVLELYKDGKNTGVVKVGYSADPFSRLKGLNNVWMKSGYYFFVKEMYGSNWARIAESDAHREFNENGLSIDIGECIDGHTELFVDDELIYEYLETQKSMTICEALQVGK